MTSFPVRRSVEQRGAVLAAAALMFAAVFVWRQVGTSPPGDAITTLYVVPIALVSLELGLRGGVLAGLLGFVLFVVWARTQHPDVDATGYVVQAVTFLAVGALAGRFGDRMRDAHARQRRLLQSGLTLARLEGPAGFSATLADEALAVSGSAGARVELTGEPTVEAGRASGEVTTVPVEVRGVRYGSLRLYAARALGDEDVAALEILALQAAVAVENGRLLTAERERAVLSAELRDARQGLEERAGQLRELLARQEAERDDVADKLHEDAAQMLAAVMLGLGTLGRELELTSARPTLQELRSEVGVTLDSLRSLAVRLRPPALRLGLRAALQDLGEAAVQRGFGEVTIELAAAKGLTPEVETMIYRIVEEALAATDSARTLTIQAGDLLVIAVGGSARPLAGQALTMVKARTELLGGRLEFGSDWLRVVIPLRRQDPPTALPSPAMPQSVG